MLDNALTRRSLIAGASGIAALAATGCVDFSTWSDQEEETASQTTSVHTTCNACSNQCGFTAYVVNGKLGKLIGDSSHPSSQGRLCARGYGYSQIVYSEDRLTDPLRKTEDGEFEAVSWDDALAEIAERIGAIVDEYGPESVALIHDPRPTGTYYTKRFMDALGSPNVYTHTAAHNLSKVSGLEQVIGTGEYHSDVENSQMTLFIGRSYADEVRPSMLAEVKRAHEAGTKIVVVDPRANAMTKFADEWIPVNPGTELAFVLAMANVIVKGKLYDATYIEEQAEGFDTWAEALASYTPSWAESITGIEAGTIERLALEMAQAAPAASIEADWYGSSSCSYVNSGETARAIACFNTLLGCWNQEGGALILPSVAPGELDEATFPTLTEPEGSKVGAQDYPLASADMGVAQAALKAAKDQTIKAMIFYDANVAADYANAEDMAEALESLELCVSIDVQLTETCQLADYVLPECSYLEATELPDFVSAKVPCVTMRNQVIDRIHSETRTCDEIFTDLAEACELSRAFPFTMEELAEAQLATLGLSVDGLAAAGTVAFSDQEFAYGDAISWNTPSGKIQFTSEACEAAGYTASPTWVEPAEMPTIVKMRLIGGNQPIQSHRQTANIAELAEITDKYDLTRVWINTDVAEELGISDGDEVVVANDYHEGNVRAKVTQRINPTAVYLPSYYGCTVPEQTNACGVGLRQTDYVAFRLEPGYGGACTQEATVTVKKAGA